MESAERHGTVRGPAHPELVSCAGTPESQRRHARAVQGGPSGAMGGIAGICADAGHAITKTSEERVTCECHLANLGVIAYCDWALPENVVFASFSNAF